MSRFGSRRSDEDVTEWPELKERPKAEDVTASLAVLSSKVDALPTVELAARLDTLADIVNVLIVELQNKGVIK